jgi:hypothetical protein
LTLAAAAGADAAGDIIFVKSTHSESTAAAVTFNWEGTAASPTRILCVSDSNEPATTLATGAVVATTGASNLALGSSNDAVYFYGIRFKAGDSTNAADITTAGGARCVFVNCAFELGGNSSTSDFLFGGHGDVFDNCTFKGSNTGSTIGSLTSGTKLSFVGCSIESGGTPGSPLLGPTGGVMEVIGCDWSLMSSSANLTASTTSGVRLFVLNCKMPASWTGSVNSSTPGNGSEFIMHNCDDVDTNYRLECKTQFGTVTHETAIYRTAGASNGTTNIAWKMVSNADAELMHQTLDSPEIVVWNETTGSSVTATVEFLIDSATTLYTGDVWMEVSYLGTSGYLLASVDTDSRIAGYLTANTTECTTGIGLANWTGESGTAKSYKLTSTFTPQEKGVISVVVKLAKASTTIYVDPMATLS